MPDHPHGAPGSSGSWVTTAPGRLRSSCRTGYHAADTDFDQAPFATSAVLSMTTTADAVHLMDLPTRNWLESDKLSSGAY